MSAAENRLQKLFKGLTAKERAIMRLRWFKEDADEPGELRQTTPWDQLMEVHGLARAADVTHHEVTWYTLWLQARLDGLKVRLGMVGCLRLWELQADEIRLLLRDAPGRPSKGQRAQGEAIRGLLERAPHLLPLDGEGAEGGPGITALGRNLVRLVARELKETQSELLALEQIVKDASDQFDGEEPIHPLARRLLDETKAAAEALRESLSPWLENLVLPDEPDEQVVKMLGEIIRQRATVP